MGNVQESIGNEWAMRRWRSALNHLNIEHSLPAEHCQLTIKNGVTK